MRKLVQEAEARGCTKVNCEEPGSRAGTLGLAKKRAIHDRQPDLVMHIFIAWEGKDSMEVFILGKESLVFCFRWAIVEITTGHC